MNRRSPDYWMDLRRRFEDLAADPTPVWGKRFPNSDWVTGGGHDSTRLALVRDTAIQAAIAAGMKGEPLTAWLDALTATPHHIAEPSSVGAGGLSLEHATIDNVARASVLLVTRLESQSMIEGPPTVPVFSRRAEWLRGRMQELKIESPWALEEKHSGPEQSRSQRVLDGKPVSEKVLNKLASALRVTRQSIPDD